MKHPRQTTPETKPKKSLSMHEDVPVWYDCCSCEAEPYWQALENEAEPEKRKPCKNDDDHRK